MSNILNNKKILYPAVFIIVLSMLMISGLKQLNNDRKELINLQAQQKEIAEIKNKISYLNQRVSFYESKKRTGKAAGIIQILDEIFSSMGLKNKLKSIKNSGSNQTIDSIEEATEIFVEKASMNELLNILYRIENSSSLLSIKKITIKKDFENPQLLNINMVISYIRQK